MNQRKEYEYLGLEENLAAGGKAADRQIGSLIEALRSCESEKTRQQEMVKQKDDELIRIKQVLLEMEQISMRKEAMVNKRLDELTEALRKCESERDQEREVVKQKENELTELKQSNKALNDEMDEVVSKFKRFTQWTMDTVDEIIGDW